MNTIIQALVGLGFAIGLACMVGGGLYALYYVVFKCRITKEDREACVKEMYGSSHKNEKVSFEDYCYLIDGKRKVYIFPAEVFENLGSSHKVRKMILRSRKERLKWKIKQ